MKYNIRLFILILIISSCNKMSESEIEPFVFYDLTGEFEITVRRVVEQFNGPSTSTDFDSNLSITNYGFDKRFQTTGIDYVVRESYRTDSILYFSTFDQSYIRLSGSYNLFTRRLEGTSLKAGNGPGTNYFFDFIVPE